MIGFIGIGVMGSGMVHNLLKNGYEVIVFTRTKEKANSVLEAGAVWADTVEECASKSDVIITMVGYPIEVEQLYEKLYAIAQNKILIDMSTSKPSLAVSIYNQFKDISSSVLDAPVSGGDVGAKNGTLSIMVGGEQPIFDEVLPIFKAMGTNINYLGKAGSGQHTKMANQVAVAGSVIGMAEAMAYAKEVGLDVQNVLDAIQKGAAGSWSLDNYAPRILKGDLNPGFYIEHYVKDLQIVVEECETVGLKLPGTEAVKKIYDELLIKGYGKLGVQAIYEYYDSAK